MGVKDNFIYEECMKELNTMFRQEKRSFGKYFDDQRDRLEKAMQNKNTQLNNEWRERYDERERKKQQEEKSNNHRIEDSLFTKEEEERIRIYEEKD